MPSEMFETETEMLPETETPSRKRKLMPSCASATKLARTPHTTLCTRAVFDHAQHIGASALELLWRDREYRKRGIHDPNATLIFFMCTDDVELTAHYHIVKISADLLETLETTQVGTASSRNENGALTLAVPVKSEACQTGLQCLYAADDIDELLRSVGFNAFSEVFQFAMYIQALNLAQLLITWASEVVVNENAIDVLGFATTVAVGQELTPDLEQRILKLIGHAVEHIGWDAILDSAEALAMLVALNFDTLSKLLWSIFVDSRTQPCTDFIQFMVLWVDGQSQRLVDVGTLLLNLSEHKPFYLVLSRICASAADLWQIQKFVAEKVTDPGSRLFLDAVFTNFPHRSSHDTPESPLYAPTSPAYSPTFDEEPQTPGYAPTSHAVYVYASDEEPETSG